MSISDPQLPLEERKAEILNQVKEALDTLEPFQFEELHVSLIHLNLKRAPVCPPGTSPSFEAVQHPDGSVSFHWVCK
jgi:hypothetical protein